MNLLLCYGTRPEYIKIQPLIDIFEKHNFKYKLLYTGQHETIVTQKADIIIKIFDDKKKNRMNQINKALFSLDENLVNEFSHILVQGDTTSALGLALYFYNLGKTIIHLEAGLRTYDLKNPFPEEANRQCISRIADIHLCPTKANLDNLIQEKCSGQIFLVGNTVLDHLQLWKNKCTYGNTILVTLHRRENHDIIDQYFKEIENLATKHTNFKFILPIHPNPNVSKHAHLLKNVEVIMPQSHSELLGILANTRLVISDSGGIQEEASFMKKKVIVCRKTTERSEGLDIFFHLCPNPKNLDELFQKLINDYQIDVECPFGDGNSASKIFEILKKI